MPNKYVKIKGNTKMKKGDLYTYKRIPYFGVPNEIPDGFWGDSVDSLLKHHPNIIVLRPSTNIYSNEEKIS